MSVLLKVIHPAYTESHVPPVASGATSSMCAKFHCVARLMPGETLGENCEPSVDDPPTGTAYALFCRRVVPASSLMTKSSCRFGFMLGYAFFQGNPVGFVVSPATRRSPLESKRTAWPAERPLCPSR